MPIYEYACTACGERTEARQGFDDPPLAECPKCGGTLRKLYSPVGIVFKGSGFYSTDAKKGKASKTKDSGGGGDKKDDKKDDTKKSDSKAETSSSTKEKSA